VHLTLVDFCEVIQSLQLSNAQKAAAILWYTDCRQPDASMTAGQLTKILTDHHLGTPNSTQLDKAIASTKLATKSKAGFALKPGSRKVIHAWLPAGIHGMQPEMDHSSGYLADSVWIDTRGYVEIVCKQLNGCFRAAYYDAASVMLRRLMETLIIEAYEKLKRSDEIKDGDGNYLMLKHLVERASGKPPHAGLNLGRDARKNLEDVKSLGDRSAHNRRFNAHSTDLISIQAGVRTTAQELIQIADLKKNT
jgi:hypothetical protein